MFKVVNMQSYNYNTVPNQFIIRTAEGKLFQSYESAIALIDRNGVVHLSDHWDYSKTTGKYRNKFLNETKAETQAKIKSGEYKMDLNIDGSLKS